MYKVDIPRVKGKMAERGFTVTSLAEKLNINRNTLSAYLKSPDKIPYAVLSAMSELLCDTAAEANSIFFAHDLRKTKEL